jgi:hypothetical protein
MTLAVTPFGKLEINTEGFALAVDKVAKLAARAESWLTVAEGLLPAFCHVRMGPAEADNAECLRLVGSEGAEGVVCGQCGAIVRMWVGGRMRAIGSTGITFPLELAPCLAQCIGCGTLVRGCKQG